MSANNPIYPKPCRFFLAGNCNRGANCKWSHDLSVDNNAATAFAYGNNTFTPTAAYIPNLNLTGYEPGATEVATNHAPQQPRTSRFSKKARSRAKGKGKAPAPATPHNVATAGPAHVQSGGLHWGAQSGSSGPAAGWEWDSVLARDVQASAKASSSTRGRGRSTSVTAESARLEGAIKNLILDVKKQPADSQPSDPAPKKDEPPPTLEKVLGGSMSVRFGPGLEILSISPITVSSSSIVIENVPLGTPSDALRALVQPFKPTISPHAIRANPRGENLRVIVHFDDTVAADEAVKALEEAEFRGRALSVKALKPTTASQDITKIECSWFTASAAALIRFMSKSDATELVNACSRSEKKIRGRRVKALAQPDHLGRRGLLLGPFGVLLVNLDPHTTQDDIEEQFSNFSSFELRPPKYNMSDHETLRYIRRKFEVDREEDLRVTSAPNDSRQRAIMNFASANDASAVYAKVKGQKDEMFEKMNFLYSLSYSASFNIPADIWKAVKQEVRRLEREEKEKEKEMGPRAGSSSAKGKGRETDDENAPARLKIIERGGHAQASVHVTGSGRPAVAKVKGAIQKLLKGKVVCDDDGKAMWDAALRGQEGRKLVQLVSEMGVHVHVDFRNRSVTLYGSPDKVDEAEEVLKEQYNLLLTMQHELSLEGSIGRLAFRGGIAAVQEYLGEEMVVVNHISNKLIVRCSPAEVSHVRSLLYCARPKRAANQGQPGQAGAASKEEDACPVCMEPAEPPVVKTTCGHTYCKGCIHGFIKATLDGRKFPITCFHSSDDGTQCTTPISISIIQESLSKLDSDQLFEASFSSYVQARPTEYSYCPTPDCPSVYQITASESVFTCSQCFLGICTSCKVATHHGQTCAQYKAATDGEKQFKDWKARAGVKTCPKCQADIEKNDGCNHMTCKCGAHLCWHCMREFPRETIYEHMRNDCLGTGIPGDIQPARAPGMPPPPPPPEVPRFFPGVIFDEVQGLAAQLLQQARERENEERERLRMRQEEREAQDRRWREYFQGMEERELVERERRAREAMARAREAREREARERALRERIARERAEQEARNKKSSGGFCVVM
ncbi:hypothetical protein BDZ91DRAFT_795718 [Kalaharituber pfeilii]|nr:hypothetical protein BDZ91DRAFT_795718 [Kalaharituber pfeilii]